MTKEDRRDFNKLYNLMSIKDLQAKYPYVNWVSVKYFVIYAVVLPRSLTKGEESINHGLKID